MSEFNYGDVFREIERHMLEDWEARHPRAAKGGTALAESLATAMLEAKAGASGPFDGAEQMRRTVMMAEWIIARLPFHGLALVEQPDGLTDDERQARYRSWLRASTRS